MNNTKPPLKHQLPPSTDKIESKPKVAFAQSPYEINIRNFRNKK